jgi:glycosyltransferase involved in cell wall biosynthesis
MSLGSPDKRRVMFLYWGRRGALTKFAYEVHKAALDDDTLEPLLSVSRQNEAFASFEPFGPSLVPVDTFARSIGALAGAWRVPSLGRELARQIAAHRSEAIITLMPHLWTPWIVPHVQRAGARYATIVHDAVAHPGDRTTARALPILLSEADRADHVFTLTEAVRQQLIASGHAKDRPITTLFHPDLSYGAIQRLGTDEGPLRLLWFGRIMPYKGLGLFVEAMELLRQRGVSVSIGVFGEGAMELYEARLRALGAEIVNRWIGENEIGSILSRYDAVALSHFEASQSGVVALAHGAGLPVIATPVGGILEQVADGVNGVLAKSTSVSDFADAVARLADPAIYERLRTNLAQRENRSMARFVRALVDTLI